MVGQFRSTLICSENVRDIGGEKTQKCLGHLPLEPAHNAIWPKSLGKLKIVL